MALMVGAAGIQETIIQPLNTDYPCPRCGSEHYYVDLTNDTPDRIYYMHTAAVCYTEVYYTLNMECGYCGYTGTLSGHYTHDVTHPTIMYGTQTINGVAITAYHCPACDYYHY